jgi:hypothetical protein
MMIATNNANNKKSILFVENHSEWQERFLSLPLESFHVAIAEDYEVALQTITEVERPYHVIVTNVDFSESENDNQGFALARKIRNLCMYTQVVFLGERDVIVRSEYAKIIFAELRGYSFIEKPLFDPVSFMKTILGAMEKADAEQRIVLISPEADEDEELLDDILKPITESLGVRYEKAGRDMPYRPDGQLDRIRLHLQSARVVVADLREKDEGAYYEYGIADALRKNPLLVAGRIQIHEKMSGLPRIDVPVHPAWKNVVRAELEKRIRSILEGNEDDSSVRREGGLDEDPILCLALIPDDPDSQDTYQHFLAPIITRLKLKVIQANNGGFQLSLPRLRNSIPRARLIILDVSNPSPFLCYCAGYAVGLGKEIILLSQNRADFPGDFAEQGPVYYSKRMQSERDQARASFELAIRDRLMSQHPDDEGESMKTVKVFINHASEDDALARSLYNELKKQPWIDPWLDTVKLLPGHDWKYEIERALDEADAVLVCMSPNSVGKTGYVQAEIRKAEERQLNRPSGKIYMIPVLLEKCNVPLDLKKYQWVDITIPGNTDLIIRSLETLL